MKPIEYILTIVVVAGACIYGTYLIVNKSAQRLPPALPPVQVTPEPTPALDPVPPVAPPSGKTITAGGVVTMTIPENCETDSGAGTTHVVCNRLDRVAITSDGLIVKIRQGSNPNWDYWNDFIASIRVKTPLSHGITIQIEQ
ncbi:hypothetical protein KBD59_03800 [Candidatus Gracilibacteria bacterium]|nr:hypothetical protein [Candidatus Gracilibacteria bacterium]